MPALVSTEVSQLAPELGTGVPAALRWGFGGRASLPPSGSAPSSPSPLGFVETACPSSASCGAAGLLVAGHSGALRTSLWCLIGSDLVSIHLRALPSLRLGGNRSGGNLMSWLHVEGGTVTFLRVVDAGLTLSGASSLPLWMVASVSRICIQLESLSSCSTALAQCPLNARCVSQSDGCADTAAFSTVTEKLYVLGCYSVFLLCFSMAARSVPMPTRLFQDAASYDK